eukprot:sb/3464867/
MHVFMLDEGVDGLKYSLFERELDTHSQHIEQVIVPASNSIAENNPKQAPEVESQIKGLKESLAELFNICAAHKACLTDESAHLNFSWKAEVVEVFITQKENQILGSATEVGGDLTSCEVLINRHSNFLASLASFNDTIDGLSELQERLTAAQHAQSKAIKQRHTDVMRRWDKLCAESEAKKKRLTTAHAHFLEIEKLFQGFAAKASQFNGWYENAEEDLTELIYTSSMEECKQLRDGHSEFVETLSQVKREEFRGLLELDKQIRSYHVSVNPYTWFTMDAIEDSWQNLLRDPYMALYPYIHRTVKERDLRIEKETLRQAQNEELRRAYATQANKFHEWLQLTKSQLTNTKLGLEEQRDLISRKHDEIKKRRAVLKEIEELSSHLEQAMVFDNKYTTHSALTLAQQWDQLNEFTRRMHHTVQDQIEALSRTGV